MSTGGGGEGRGRRGADEGREGRREDEGGEHFEVELGVSWVLCPGGGCSKWEWCQSVGS